MNANALILMGASMLLIWGGLAGAVVFLARRPERPDMPSGGEDDPPPTA